MSPKFRENKARNSAKFVYVTFFTVLQLYTVLSYLLAIVRCCRAVSFSDNVSESELAKNCKSATVDSDVLEPRCLTKSD